MILINAMSASSGGGVTYIKNLCNYCGSNDESVIFLFTPQNIGLYETVLLKYKKIRYEVIPQGNRPVIRALWEIFILPKFIRELGVNVYYNPGGINVTRMPPGVESVVTLRNMLPFNEVGNKSYPRFSPQRARNYILKLVYLLSYRLSDKVIFISKYSRSVVEKHYNQVVNKSTVIEHGFDPLFLQIDTGKCNINIPSEDYILYVSVFDYYKNQLEVIIDYKAYRDKGGRAKLVLVGKVINNYGKEVLNKINEMELQDYVIHYDGVRHEDLPQLYKNAKILLFASHCECCPNILIEMMSFSKPIVCSSYPPMPEFGQKSVVYYDPHSTGELAHILNELEHDIERQKALRIKTEENIVNFSWDKCFTRTLDYIRDE